MEKLNNLLGFKEFSTLNNDQLKKITKRTEIGGDVINEHVYDKIRLAAKEERDYKKLIDDIKKYILNSCKGGQVENISIDGDIIKFTINKRKFTVDKSENSMILYGKKYEKYLDDKKKKKNKETGEEETVATISKEVATEIFDAVKKCK